jgi:hypothetical protein
MVMIFLALCSYEVEVTIGIGEEGTFIIELGNECNDTSSHFPGNKCQISTQDF